MAKKFPRDQILRIRLTKGEKMILETAAKIQNTTISEFVRKTVIGKAIAVILSSDQTEEVMTIELGDKTKD